MTTEDRLKCPKTTSNNLADIISWIKLGDCVVLTNGRYMMPYGKIGLEKDPKNYRTIYVDISSYASLGNEDEWPYYILQEGGIVCDKSMHTQILSRSNPNSYNMTLNF